MTPGATARTSTSRMPCGHATDAGRWSAVPIIGPLPGRRGAYIAVMHSAVTLAASAGRLVAAEVLDARTFRELQHLRPDRFTTTA